jgi:hypothetical protein
MADRAVRAARRCLCLALQFFELLTNLPHPIPYNQLMLTRPAILLRAEEAVLLTLTVFAYQHLHYSWLLFVLLFFAPDLSMLGYLINTRIGAATYNFAHTLTLALVLLLASYVEQWHQITPLALIWVAHIAFDRLLGYGLKYPTAFKDTHLHRIS